MTANPSFDNVRSYMDLQLGSALPEHAPHRNAPGPAVTLSRQAGCGSHTIAEKLAAYLDRHSPPAKIAWTVFDRSLVDKVLEEHNLPKELARFLPEDRRSYLDDIMEELVGLHPSSWTLVRQSAETILHLAELGRVILIGRGSHVITARMPRVFHVRLVAPVEQRIQHVVDFHQLSPKEAERFVRSTDRGRARYLKTHFQSNIDDVLPYDLVMNTERLGSDEAAEIIGTAALKLFAANGTLLKSGASSRPAGVAGAPILVDDSE